MSEADALLIDHMLIYAGKAVGISGGLPRDIYDREEVYQFALAYLVQTVGEAAYHVSSDLKGRHRHIEWNKIQGTRHRIVHGYTDVDYGLVWIITRERLPELIQQLQALLRVENDPDSIAGPSIP